MAIRLRPVISAGNITRGIVDGGMFTMQNDRTEAHFFADGVAHRILRTFIPGTKQSARRAGN